MAQDRVLRIINGSPTSTATADNIEDFANAEGAVVVNDAVYISASSTVAKASTAQGWCIGIVFELNGTTACRVITAGLLENFSTGMEVGTRYFLTTTPGVLSTAASGWMAGVAVSATSLLVSPRAVLTVGTTAPAMPSMGDLWVDTN